MPFSTDTLALDVLSADPGSPANGQIWYNSTTNSVRSWQNGAVVDLGSGGGLSKAQHDALRSLIHFIDGGPAEGFASGSYRENTGTAFPSAIIWWTSAVKTLKIVEKDITYTGAFPTTIAWKMYDAAGSLLVTVTDTITYSGAFETHRARTIA